MKNIQLLRITSKTLLVLLMVFLINYVSAAVLQKIPYTWDNVAIGGGGSVPGLIIHPQIRNLVYIRTDMGSMYRWEAQSAKWIPIWLWPSLDEWNLTSVASFAIAPSDTTGNIIYAAAGKYADNNATPKLGEIYKSTDRGETWKATGLKAHIASNWDQRFGERLNVDPHNADHVYFASRMDGLFKSENGGKTWNKIQEAPNGNNYEASAQNQRGLTFLVFDSRSGEKGLCCKMLYLGAWRNGVYRSTDGGATWSKLPGSPERSFRATVDSKGRLYVTHRYGLAKFDGAKWTDITPTAFKDKRFAAVAVDPSNADHLLTAPNEWAHNMPIFRSTDGGTTWTKIKFKVVNDVPWRPKDHWASAVFTLTFDPHDPKGAGYSDWYHSWMTPDITADVTEWYTFERGHEALTPVAMASPSDGNVVLYTGIPDIGGFDHTSVTEFPKQTIRSKGLERTSTTSIDFAANDPEFVVRANAKDWGDFGEIGCAFTYDAGATWEVMPTKPFEEATGGRVAVSATGDRVVWMPQESCMFYTKDLGENWRETYGAPENLVNQFTSTRLPLASDRVLNNVFYVYANGKFYRSDNGAELWEQVGVVIEGEDQHPILRAAPSMPHEVWISLNKDGLWRSNDGGETFEKIPGVTQSMLFDFGKNPPGKMHPTVYVFGKIYDREGIYRSDDMGKNWHRIDTFPNPALGAQPNTLCADQQVYGRVYIGTNGTGIFYGEPVK